MNMPTAGGSGAVVDFAAANGSGFDAVDVFATGTGAGFEFGTAELIIFDDVETAVCEVIGSTCINGSHFLLLLLSLHASSGFGWSRVT